jgi:RNA polymerase sigma-70 factor (sigma-E family)
VIPEVGTRATEILEQHEKEPTLPRSRETQHFGHYTHEAFGVGFIRMVSEPVSLQELRVSSRRSNRKAPGRKARAPCNLCEAWTREECVMTAPEELDFVSWAQVAAPRLRRLGFLITGDWHLAEDLTQDALIRIYSVWGRVSRTGSPNAYASRVVVNANRSWLRLARNRERPIEHLPDRTDPASAETTDSDLQDQLASALAHLGASQRRIVVLRYWEGRSEAEVAQMLDLSQGTVKSQGSRGLARLKELLAADDLRVRSKGTPT